MKEVIAVIRPERYHETKQRVQRLRLPALTQHRVLGRGHARGLRYLPRRGATPGTGVRYLPKRMLSWIVEETQVEPLIRALIEANQTGQLGDGKIFVLPVEETIRIRTGERGVETIQTQQPFELLWGAPTSGSEPVEVAHAHSTSLRAMVSERSESGFDVAQHDPERVKRVEGSNHASRQ